jgi:DNA-binding NarL/FixJ family response regulator
VSAVTQGPVVILADQEPMFLEGLRGLCSREGLFVAATTTFGQELIPLIARDRPDLAIVGTLVGPKGRFEIVRAIAESSPRTNVLLLTDHLDERRLANAWHSGARGVAPRSLAPEDLLFAVKEVAAGRTYVWRGGRCNSRTIGNAAPLLTSREYDVLGLIADGRSIKQIASVLGIAPKTVEHHREHICKKLAVQTTAHLVRSAVRLGLVAP